MKYLKKFEELSTETYRRLRNRTSDYPQTRFSAGTNPEGQRLANKMQNINQLSKERFEEEFYKEFPKDVTQVRVYDSKNPQTKLDLNFSHLQWRANWTYYDLMFKDLKGKLPGYIRFHGDMAIAADGEVYSLDKFSESQGDIIPDEHSQEVLKLMFSFGSKKNEPTKIQTEQEPIQKEEPSFLGRVKNFLK